MKPVRLHDELPSKQEQQCQQLGDGLYDDADFDSDGEWGGDPLDALIRKEEQEDKS